MAEYGAIQRAALAALRDRAQNTKQIGTIIPSGSGRASVRALRALKALEAQGLVADVGCTDDDGAIRWEITDAGRAALALT